MQCCICMLVLSLWLHLHVVVAASARILMFAVVMLVAKVKMPSYLLLSQLVVC